MKIAIMQPYFLPYIGYFQLVKAVDKFIFLDDVNFIKKGWINRNQLKDNFKFAIPLKHQSQNKLIKDIKIKWNDKLIIKFRKNLSRLYCKSPQFDLINSMLDKIMCNQYESISELAITSITDFSKYLNIKTEFKISSKEKYLKSKNRIENIINICKKEGADIYLNLPRGKKIYSKKDFTDRKIQLGFLNTIDSNSIIDLCFNYEKNIIEKKINNYKIIY